MRHHAVITGMACGLVALLVAACGTVSPPAAVTTGAVPLPVPSGVAVGAAALAGSTPLGGHCAPLSDVAPTGPLPAPGHMPAGSTMARIQARGYLVVGVDQTTRYFGYRDGQGNLVGFDDDVARQVATAIFGNKPNTIHFVVITSAQRIPDVQSGTVDLVADNMTITCDRLKLVAFSSDYYNAGMTILVPSNSGVTSVGQLGGQRVCAAHATTSINEIGQLVPPPIPVSVQNWTDCLVLLQQGQVAAISTDNSVLVGLQNQDPDTVIPKTAPFTCEPHGLAMSRDPAKRDFVRFVNGVLEQMRTDGQWQKLYKHWTGRTQLGPQSPPPPQYDVAVEHTCSWP
jgi:polar amino acid transport system substrate-binding protein